MRRIIVLLTTLTATLVALAQQATAQDYAAPAFHKLASCLPTTGVICPSQFNTQSGFKIDLQHPFSLLPGDHSSSVTSAAFFGGDATLQNSADLMLSRAFIDGDEFTLGGRLSYWLNEAADPHSAQPDPSTLAINLNAIYQFSNGPLSFTPGGRLMYSQTEQQADSSLAQPSAAHALSALTLSLGGQVSYGLKNDWGLLMPFASFQWTHEIDAEQSPSGNRLISDIAGQPLQLQSVSSLDTTADRDYFNLGVGFSAEFNNGAAAFMNYQQLLGHDDVDDYRVNAGFRLDF